jgi:hypothetical protein
LGIEHEPLEIGLESLGIEHETPGIRFQSPEIGLKTLRMGSHYLEIRHILGG